MNLPAIPTALVYVDFGRWLARCDCACATTFGYPGFPPVLASSWRCQECGYTTEAIWPSVEMMQGIQRLLLLRRHRKNQNWMPGETLIDLHMENGANGVYDFLDGTEIEPGASLLMVSDEGIVSDMLPMLNPRRDFQALVR